MKVGDLVKWRTDSASHFLGIILGEGKGENLIKIYCIHNAWIPENSEKIDDYCIDVLEVISESR
jgi:uncharacterized protein YijF (DUF1287 family)